MEWIGLALRHPDLFEAAKRYEKEGGESFMDGFTWSEGESLNEMVHPDRVAEIERKHAKAMAREAGRRSHLRLVEVFEDVLDEDDDEQPCIICSL